jgi:dTDP-glucose 4,6-dehydratase
VRILVTGGAGFIGSLYVRTLLDGGYRGYEEAHVTVVDKLSYAGNRRNLPASHPRLTFVHGDICDLPLLKEVFPGHDAVVHFAAESHVDRSLESAGEFVRTNVGGTQSVVEACLDAGIGRSWTGPGGDEWRLTLGFTHEFAVRALIPTRRR